MKLATAESSSEGGQVSPAGGPVQSEGRFRGVTKSIGKPPISNSKEQTNHESTNNQILIIEDNPDVRTYIRESIEENHQVIEASDGQEGIEKAIEHIPDLIISDVMMPRKDGFEVCETLKKEEKNSHIPIILLTAKAGTENRITGWQTGADDYLIKPFNVTELQMRIANLITLRKALQQKYSLSLIHI